MVSFWCLYGFIKRVMTEIPPTYSPGSSGERDSNILTWTRKKGNGFIRFFWKLAEYISRQLSDKSDKSASIFYKPQILGISQMQITSASEIIPLICEICGHIKLTRNKCFINVTINVIQSIEKITLNSRYSSHSWERTWNGFTTDLQRR